MTLRYIRIPDRTTIPALRLAVSTAELRAFVILMAGRAEPAGQTVVERYTRTVVQSGKILNIKG